MSHRVGAFLLYHEALLHDQHSSFAECINAFFSLALIISYAYAYDRPAADTYAHSRVISFATLIISWLKDQKVSCHYLDRLAAQAHKSEINIEILK